MFDFLLKLLVFFCVLFLFLLIVYLIIRHKIRKVFDEDFGIRDIKKFFEMTKRESIETSKSLSSMEKFILPSLMDDFPDLNI